MRLWGSWRALRQGGLLCLASALAAPACAEMQINFPEPASAGARDIYDIHMLTMRITFVLLVLIYAVVCYSLFVHRKSRGAVADQRLHLGKFARWSWVLVPIMVLGVDLTIAGSAENVLHRLWLVPKDEDMLEVKVVGHQWWWEYEYLDQKLNVESRALPPEKAGEHYLREVDHRLVLPTHTRIRFLHTSADVNHAFWVPELGMKKDAIAGYVTETWAVIDREGVFRGQCAELCGTWHAKMPVVVEAISPEKFSGWVEEQRKLAAVAAAEAASDKVWSKEDLIERGRDAYNKSCAACHQLDGKGLPPAFPPLIAGQPFPASADLTKPLADRGFFKDGKIVLGTVEHHLDIILRGIPGTAMQPWAQLNNLDVAAIATYERNAWGNDTGDVVQPADVEKARAASQTAAAQ
ncbi:MAG TPA: cytochrome c oxidase subunit II [Gammaproteobacteria bacterium]|nr:cytochrome c oxidase subunit II [Gammaproteobacteria bacterium]